MPHPFSQPRPVIRPALPLDRDAVLEFCKFIWEGDDYIPYVWDDWMADPSGQMFVAEHAGKAVGLGRLTLLAPGQWWLEGLRVDPAYQDRKIGSLMNEYLNNLWLERCEGVVRLMTSSQRVKVHHMCKQQGFARIAERRFYVAEPQDGPDAAGGFATVPQSEVDEAVAFSLAADSRSLTGPLADVGWRFAPPTAELFRNFLGREDAQARWWRGRKGLVLAWEDDWDEGRFMLISLAACASHDLPAMLLDLRGLAASRCLYRVAWNADTQPQLVTVLAEAGFKGDEGSSYIFEKRHPTRP
jgi:GNAT superfamily N-acetyltransferase